MAVAGLQVVGGHLKAVPFHGIHQGLLFGGALLTRDPHIAGQHQRLIARIAAQLLQRITNELIHIAMVVGEQNPRLHRAPITAGVMH